MIIRLNIFLNKVSRAVITFVNHQWSRYGKQGMHTVTTLQESGKGSIREVILHLEQVDQFGHDAALLNHGVEVVVGVLNKFLDRLLVSKYTVLLVIFKHTEVGFTGHQKSLLNNVYKTESKEVQRNVHEVGCVERHFSDDVIADNF